MTEWNHIYLTHEGIFRFFQFWVFPLTPRKWSECAERYVPLPSQSELSLQHHSSIAGFSSQLWHRESHGFKRHHQDPQSSLQRVSVHTPTCGNQECQSGWTILEPPASEKPVLVPVDRVVFVKSPVGCSAHCPLSARMYACDDRPSFVQLYPQLWSYCPIPPLSNRCI